MTRPLTSRPTIVSWPRAHTMGMHSTGVAYHVESDYGLRIRILVAGPRIANNTTGWPRKDSSKTAELVVAHKTAVGLHEFDPRLMAGA